MGILHGYLCHNFDIICQISLWSKVRAKEGMPATKIRPWEGGRRRTCTEARCPCRALEAEEKAHLHSQHITLPRQLLYQALEFQERQAGQDVLNGEVRGLDQFFQLHRLRP